MYERIYVAGRPGQRQAAFAEDAFEHIAYLLDLLPEENATELIVRLSDGVDDLKVAELYNVLIWSADARGLIDPEEIQQWFYGKQRRRVAIAAQVDIFPSNSMDECERILEILNEQFPDLDYLLRPLAVEVANRQREEKAWSDYRKETFEMPKEMTPSIMNIIKDIKQR